jgi:hypothetical protein
MFQVEGRKAIEANGRRVFRGIDGVTSRKRGEKPESSLRLALRERMSFLVCISDLCLTVEVYCLQKLDAIAGALV